MSNVAENPVPRNVEGTIGPVDIPLVEDNVGNGGLPTEVFAAGETETEIDVARDGAEALECPYEHGSHADVPCPPLVLLDCTLPRRNSEAGLAEVRIDADVPQLPVIMLSSSNDEAEVTRSDELAANANLTTSVGPSEFIELIDAFESVWLSRFQLPLPTGNDQ